MIKKIPNQITYYETICISWKEYLKSALNSKCNFFRLLILTLSVIGRFKYICALIG